MREKDLARLTLTFKTGCLVDMSGHLFERFSCPKIVFAWCSIIHGFLIFAQYWDAVKQRCHKEVVASCMPKCSSEGVPKRGRVGVAERVSGSEAGVAQERVWLRWAWLRGRWLRGIAHREGVAQKKCGSEGCG